VRKVDNLTAIFLGRLYRKCVIVDISQPFRSPRPVIEIDYVSTYLQYYIIHNYQLILIWQIFWKRELITSWKLQTNAYICETVLHYRLRVSALFIKIKDQLMSIGPLWSSGQSAWLHIQRSVFDSRRYQIFWEVVGLERGPLIVVSAIEELLERKISCPGL
jgi:hypothetical protein